MNNGMIRRSWDEEVVLVFYDVMIIYRILSWPGTKYIYPWASGGLKLMLGSYVSICNLLPVGPVFRVLFCIVPNEHRLHGNSKDLKLPNPNTYSKRI